MKRDGAVKLPPRKPTRRHCNGETRGRTYCHNEPGFKTDHPGSGRCAFHGGATEAGKKAAGKEAALNFAAETVGEVSIDPLDGMLLSVRIAAGLVDYWQRQIGHGVNGPSLEGLERSATMLNRFTKAALDADVNGRLVSLAERAADPISFAAEEALAALVNVGVVLTVEQRTVYAKAFESALAKHEEDPFTIEGTASRQLVA